MFNRLKFTLRLLAIFSFSLGISSTALAERPNIVIFLLDDLGYADVGFMPNAEPDIYTPNIDQLANEGVVFSQAYVTHPFCGPSRAGIMTGRMQHEHGAQFNLAGYSKKGVDVNETFFSTVLQDAGYRTGLIGKWHLGEEPQYHPNSRGFDYFYGMLGGGHKYHSDDFVRVADHNPNNTGVWDYEIPLIENRGYAPETGYETGNQYITDLFSDAGTAFIEESENNDDQPFLLFMSYNAPHTPEEAKQEDEEALRTLLGANAATDPQRHTYSAMVYAVDRGVQKIVNKLKETDEYENTLIVFLSDNGGRLNNASARNTPLRDGKGATYEGGVRVPMFISWPNGDIDINHYSHPVSSLDLYPTLINLAGASKPAGKELDGVNILSHLRNNTNARENTPLFFMRHDPNGNNPRNRTAVILNQWKWYTNGYGVWQFFDLATDMAEQNPISNHASKDEMLNDVYRWSLSHIEPLFFDQASYGFENGWVTNNMPNFAQTFPDQYQASDYSDFTSQVKTIELPYNAVSAVVGSELQIDALVYPANANDKSLSWVSSDTSVATVSQSGLINVLKAGTTTVTASANSNSHSTTSLLLIANDADANLIHNAGFEQGNIAWLERGNTSVVEKSAYEGSSAAYLAGEATVQQTLVLAEYTRYTLTGWAKVLGEGEEASFQVKNTLTGAVLASVNIDSTNYTQYSVDFITANTPNTFYTTQVYSGASGVVYADNISLTRASNQPEAETETETETETENNNSNGGESNTSAPKSGGGNTSALVLLLFAALLLRRRYAK